MLVLKRSVRIITRLTFFLIAIAVIFVVLILVAIFWLDKTNGQIETLGQVRKYLLYIPESLDPSTPAPLVISLHGFAEWPTHQMSLSHWNDLAEENGFLVVYPSGSRFPKRWKTSLAANATGGASMDVQFISDLIDHLVSEYNIDQTRIYANGLSNGGGMAVLLACMLSDRIAAVGSIAGAYQFSPADCSPSQLVPLMAFLGSDDPIVPYVGKSTSSVEYPLPVIPDWIEMWAELNKCNLSANELPSVGEVSGIRYTQCAQNAEVIFYTIHGGGHSWPGGESLPEWIVGHTTSDINASEVMWEFFDAHHLNGE